MGCFWCLLCVPGRTHNSKVPGASLIQTRHEGPLVLNSGRECNKPSFIHSPAKGSLREENSLWISGRPRATRDVRVFTTILTVRRVPMFLTHLRVPGTGCVTILAPGCMQTNKSVPSVQVVGTRVDQEGEHQHYPRFGTEEESSQQEQNNSTQQPESRSQMLWCGEETQSCH